jgi:hypothetical protein
MKSYAICLTLLSTLGISIAANLPAQAQRARVFVSVSGNDANPCTAGSPCKTFQAAYNAVLAGGEISVLDTGGYGTLTISKAVSIVAAGVEASIAIPSGGVGITINAGSTDKVALRGLTLDGQGVGFDGIQFNSGASLTVESCVVRNMNSNGLVFSSSATMPQTLAVSNSYFNENGNEGIFILTQSSGTISAAIDRTGFYANGDSGLFVVGTSGTGALTVAVTDTVAANGTTGFFVGSDTGKSITNLSVTRVLAEGNSFSGVTASGANATLWLAQSTLSGNAAGYIIFNGPAVLNSYGDNYIDKSNGPPAGTLTSFAKQ